MPNPLDGQAFLDALRPVLAAGDAAALARTVLKQWTPRCLCTFLRDCNVDVRRVAAVTLGLVGDRSIEPCLVHALHDTDEQVNQMAEHGLWAIWFRSGSPESSKPFQEGMALMALEDYQRAAERFEHASKLDPGFAEAFNQCAIAHFFVGSWKPSIMQCCRTIKLVPDHFGAIAGMGHCYAQLGELNMALRCYRRALKINPRMAAIAKAARRLEERLRDPGESGMFSVDHIMSDL